MTENQIDSYSFGIGCAFANVYRNRTGRFINNVAFCKKYKQYFDRAAAMFAGRNGFNTDKFIESFFYGEDVKYPQQLPYEHNWEKYVQYISNTKNDDNEEECMIARKLVSSATVFKKYGSMNNFISSGKYYLNQIEQGYNDFDLLLFWFSKTFLKYYEENKERFKEKYNPEIIRITPSHYQKITAKIKQLLGDDCIWMKQ